MMHKARKSATNVSSLVFIFIMCCMILYMIYYEANSLLKHSY